MLSHGDYNPLYTDPEYAKNTRYGCMLTYPTFLHRVRYGISYGLNSWGPWPTSTLVAGMKWDFYDVIRINSRFRSSMKMSNVFAKKGRTGLLVFYITETSFWNQRDELVSAGGGTYICVGKTGEQAKVAEETAKKGEGMSKTMLYDRLTYKYSDEEVEKIIADVNNEETRSHTKILGKRKCRRYVNASGERAI